MPRETTERPTRRRGAGESGRRRRTPTLEASQWNDTVVVSGVRLPGGRRARLDHVVVGPRGIWSVRAPVDVPSGPQRDLVLAECAEDALALVAVLGVDVTAALLVQSGTATGRIHGVAVGDRAGLVETMRQSACVLTPQQVQAATAVLRGLCPEAGAAAAGALHACLAGTAPDAAEIDTGANAARRSEWTRTGRLRRLVAGTWLPVVLTVVMAALVVLVATGPAWRHLVRTDSGAPPQHALEFGEAHQVADGLTIDLGVPQVRGDRVRTVEVPVRLQARAAVQREQAAGWHWEAYDTHGRRLEPGPVRPGMLQFRLAPGAELASISIYPEVVSPALATWRTVGSG